MANEIRLRQNSLGGLIEDNPLTDVATTLTSGGLAAMGVVDATNHMAVVLDPDGMAGAPEIVHVTDHASGATTATILRGQEDTTAREHPRDIPWVHAQTTQDYASYPALLASKTHNPVTQVAVTATTTALVDVDATNLAVTFTVPPSGAVKVTLQAVATAGASTIEAWGLREGTADVATTTRQIVSNAEGRYTFDAYVSGLTPGATLTYKWAHARPVGTAAAQVRYGGVAGQAVMEVYDAQPTPGGVPVLPASSMWEKVLDDPGTSLAAWTSVGGTWAANAGGYLEQTATGAVYNVLKYNTLTPPGAGFIMESEIRFPISALATRRGMLGPAGSGAAAAQELWAGLQEEIDAYIFQQGTTAAVTAGTPVIAEDVWYKVRLTLMGAYITMAVDGVHAISRHIDTASTLTDVLSLISYQGPIHFRNIKAWRLVTPA